MRQHKAEQNGSEGEHDVMSMHGISLCDIAMRPNFSNASVWTLDTVDSNRPDSPPHLGENTFFQQY
jgi:hypothetical protein